MGKKYELLLDKVYEQIELSTWVAEHFTIHPAHHHYKQFYYQEWDERDRYFIKDLDISMIISMHLTFHKIKVKMQTEEFGLSTSLKSG